MFIYKTQSLCCTAEINNIVDQSYFNQNKKERKATLWYTSSSCELHTNTPVTRLLGT